MRCARVESWQSACLVSFWKGACTRVGNGASETPHGMTSRDDMDHSGAPGAGGARRSAPLDLLRLLAAVLIVLFHFKDDGPIELYLGHPILQRGYLATDFFLILSGYVLGRSYGPKIVAGLMSDGRFVLRRILRVWPAHAIMLASFAAIILITGLAGRPTHHEGEFLWRNLPAQLFLMQAWGIDRFLQLHAVINHIHHHLHDTGRDAAAAGGSDYHHQLVAFGHDGRCHRA